MTIVSPPPLIDRDRWGRPMVIPPSGGKPVAYTRCTTYVSVLEDQFNLQKWAQRMVALGLASRPDLLLSVQAHKDDKRELDAICEKAREAAAASAAATTGTALHALTELVDRGEELPPLPPGPRASLDAYRTTMAGIKPLHIERFSVLDTLKVGGTPDRILKVPGMDDPVIGDIKTGTIELGILKIAMQLGVYSRSYLYDIPTGRRDIHGADTTRALIIHLPATDDPAQARCDLVWVDIEAGWYAVNVATQVREKRRLKFADLTEPYAGAPPHIRPGAPRVAGVETNTAMRREKADLGTLIDACSDADSVRALWAAHEREWTDALTERARRRIAQLPAAS